LNHKYEMVNKCTVTVITVTITLFWSIVQMTDSEIHTLIEHYIFNALLVFHTRVDVPWTLDDFQGKCQRDTVLVSIVFCKRGNCEICVPKETDDSLTALRYPFNVIS